MAEPKEKPLNELLSHDIVDIYVGSENTHWALHEKLLCHRSKFFRNVFWSKEGNRKNQTFGLPDEDDQPFRLFVGWLYSDIVVPPREEKDLGVLFDLYLMGEKWESKRLKIDVLEAVRRWYHDTDTWPSLRRVQYIYANTEVDSPMRQLLVSCVARMLVLGEDMPGHWERALRRNGQLAVDIILCVQKWHFEPENIPDAREESVVPLYDDVEQTKEIKQEENDGQDQQMTNGTDHQEEDMPDDGGDDQEIKQEPEDS